MHALTYGSPWNISLEEKPDPPTPVGDQVLVRLRASGICGTDIGIISGQYPAEPSVTLGHESSGEVKAIGAEVRALRIGDRVVIDPTYFCSHCYMCRTGRPNHCTHKAGTETGVTRDGTFSPYYTTQERFLYKIADDVSFEAAALSEPLSCALTGVGVLRTRPDLRTVVLGAGPMGILYTHALRTRAISGAVVELSAPRLALARQAIPRGWVCSETVPEGRFDLVVDTTGVLCGEVFPRLERGGQFLAVGLRQYTFPIDMRRVADESLTIVGSIDSLDNSFATAAHLINSKAIPAESIVTHRLDLSKYVEGFGLLGCDLTRKRHDNCASAIKVVLRPGQ